MSDPSISNFARIIVEHSTAIQPGDRVAVLTGMEGVALATELFTQILARGGMPHVLFDLPDQDELFFAYASDELLDVVPSFHRMAFEEFDVLIKARTEANTRALSRVDSARQAQRQRALSRLLKAQLQRGADGSLRWMSTQFPTAAYAMEAEMGTQEYQDFFFRACHADPGTADPVGYWQNIQLEQHRIVNLIEGHNRVHLRGPNVDLSLSILGRKFVNASGQHNLPDGEIYTGPVEDSANGWVRFTYPAIYQSRVVEGIELTFKDGRVVDARAARNHDFLLLMLETDAGARYIGEFAIGTNFQISQFSHNILLDEKIGGSFHMALGASYPETGGRNQSVIHWDMICDLRQDSQIEVDGELIYQDGQFVL